MRPGTLLISLDFELHWGVFHSVTESSPYMQNLLNTPEAIIRMLELFENRNISATWAIVGLLFAESPAMIKEFEPKVKPAYMNPCENPYLLKLGLNESDDPIHFAGSLIRKIITVPGQEIATHTFSHFFCRADGATVEAFLSDIESARKIAELYGIEINSIVFPKNQLIKEFIDVLPQQDINVFRGAEKGWMYTGIKDFHESKLSKSRRYLNKLGRFLDTYFPISGSSTWSTLELEVQRGQPINVPASRFVRPYSPRLKYLETLKYKRIADQIEHAAKSGKMVHLRWHPHNFGSHTDKNMELLSKILDSFEYCRSKYGMRSMTMQEYAGLLNIN